MSALILVVDDEPDVADLFRQQFRREIRSARFAMEFAQSAPEALKVVEMVEDASLILILSDINMPGMDGLALLREIKHRRPELPVVMVTAYGDDERRRTAKELGAAAFLAKPVDFDRLKQHLAELIPRSPNA